MTKASEPPATPPGLSALEVVGSKDIAELRITIAMEYDKRSLRLNQYLDAPHLSDLVRQMAFADVIRNHVRDLQARLFHACLPFFRPKGFHYLDFDFESARMSENGLDLTGIAHAWKNEVSHVIRVPTIVLKHDSLQAFLIETAGGERNYVRLRFPQDHMIHRMVALLD